VHSLGICQHVGRRTFGGDKGLESNCKALLEIKAVMRVWVLGLCLTLSFGLWQTSVSGDLERRVLQKDISVVLFVDQNEDGKDAAYAFERVWKEGFVQYKDMQFLLFSSRDYSYLEFLKGERCLWSLSLNESKGFRFKLRNLCLFSSCFRMARWNLQSFSRTLSSAEV